MSTNELKHVAVYGKPLHAVDNRDPYLYEGTLHCFVPHDGSVIAVVELDDGTFRAADISHIKVFSW